MTDAKVGQARLGNGDAVTIFDIRASRAADVLAKHVAHKYRVLEAIRAKVAHQADLIQRTVKRIGYAD